MEDADIMCLQETKLKDSDVDACEKLLRPGLQDWHFYFNNSAAKKGYSGVAILSRCSVTASHLTCMYPACSIWDLSLP